jgi:Protein of unknown function (DUF3761)
MTDDHDDPDQDPYGSADLYAWLMGLWKRQQVQETDPSEPSWRPGSAPRPPRSWPAALVVMLVVLAAVGVAIGLWTRSHRPSPEYALVARRPVRVYDAPSSDSAVVRTLLPGERVLAGRPISRRWGVVFETDREQIGYAYESADNFGPAPADGGPVVPSPGPVAQGDTTALCKDGWVSRSQHRSGTCSWHGGVGRWVHRPPS